jgi:excisionase family DNA binding protein
MTSVTRTRTAELIPLPGVTLQLALDSFARALAKKVLALISPSLPDQATCIKIRQSLDEQFAGLLEAEFANDLLRDLAKTSVEKRTLLTHLLTEANVKALTIEGLPKENVVDLDVESAAEFLTSEEAAKMLRLSRTHVNALIDAGKLGDILKTEGGHRRVTRGAVLDYLEARKVTQRKGIEQMMEESAKMGLYKDE